MQGDHPPQETWEAQNTPTGEIHLAVSGREVEGDSREGWGDRDKGMKHLASKSWYIERPTNTVSLL